MRKFKREPHPTPLRWFLLAAVQQHIWLCAHVIRLKHFTGQHETLGVFGEKSLPSVACNHMCNHACKTYTALLSYINARSAE